MLAWGIEMGDMLVVEKMTAFFIGDLVGIRKTRWIPYLWNLPA